jgi:hypothetical protein
VTYVASVWIVLETINIAWPRNLYGTWYLNWGLLIMTGVLAVVGFFVMQWAFHPQRESGAPRPQLETLPEEV